MGTEWSFAPVCSMPPPSGEALSPLTHGEGKVLPCPALPRRVWAGLAMQLVFSRLIFKLLILHGQQMML